MSHQEWFRWLPASATYSPSGPWPGDGRFDDGETPTLYLAASDRGALAEFFRRAPDMFDFAEQLGIVMYQVPIRVHGRLLDLTDDAVRSEWEIGIERLNSSDESPDSRYRECRDIARRAREDGYVGILFPSASAAWVESNVVLFGDPSPTTWEAGMPEEAPLPSLEPEEVNCLF